MAVPSLNAPSANMFGPNALEVALGQQLPTNPFANMFYQAAKMQRRGDQNAMIGSLNTVNDKQYDLGMAGIQGDIQKEMFTKLPDIADKIIGANSGQGVLNQLMTQNGMAPSRNTGFSAAQDISNLSALMAGGMKDMSSAMQSGAEAGMMPMPTDDLKEALGIIGIKPVTPTSVRSAAVKETTPKVTTYVGGNQVVRAPTQAELDASYGASGAGPGAQVPEKPLTTGQVQAQNKDPMAQHNNAIRDLVLKKIIERGELETQAGKPVSIKVIDASKVNQAGEPVVTIEANGQIKVLDMVTMSELARSMSGGDGQ